ncbi:hypothetical protein, variant [Aphanomyces astaci]|uniref:PI3K/PI4K catalytic domain-containing protein n=1 Tax=Aphanomyces astaci TaxID=112090 RepID=W4FTD7_APHAT|nr:hypothetical protein, variant [Aphanomyces astaci]ETV70780.1 hypothetical protein, variant [Aphanomyces astaci]|eukprot:XP_009839843.1 hypothetical protein, variant [Aphanomyces astaci]
MGVDQVTMDTFSALNTQDANLRASVCSSTCRSFVYKAHLALHITSASDDTPAITPHHRTLCWLLDDGTLTWTTMTECVESVLCRAATVDDSDFLNERFFITTATGEVYTCYSKCRLERDAWMHALLSTLHNNAPPSSPHDDPSDSMDRIVACSAVVHEQLASWTSILTDMLASPYGMWKETRHWRRFGMAERRPYMDLQMKMTSSAEVDGLSLVIGLYVYHQNPMMILAILCQLARLMDTCPSQVEMYWPQILHWGITSHAVQSVNMQLFYLYFVAGVCRRSLPLAIKSSWECDAAKIDAVGDPSRYAAISLIQVYASMISLTDDNNNATAAMVDKLFVSNAPDTSKTHQILLQSLFTTSTSLLRNHPATNSTFGEWLAATSEADIARVHETWSTLPSFVDPLPVPSEEVPINDATASDMTSLRGRMVDANDMEDVMECLNEVQQNDKQQDVSSLVIFQDTMHVVNSLIVASQNFKRQIEDPRDRKKHLPAVLTRLRATMPSHAMLPLDQPCWITDVLVNEGTVFSTKARAPTMVWFEGLHVTSISDVPTAMPELSPVVYLSEVLLADILSPSSSPSSFSSRESSMTEAHLSVFDSCKVRTTDDFSIFTSMQSFADKKSRIRKERKGVQPGWDVVPVIAKSLDDMRQEVFVMQLMHVFDHIFRCEGLGGLDQLWLRPYSIMCCGDNCGLMEVLTDSMSVSDAKMQYISVAPPGCVTASLVDIFSKRYGDPDSTTYAVARKNFVRSMAAYSLFCYVLQDRHNGNLMLHAEGYVMHIDFGFCFGTAPGGAFSIEGAPFKLTDDMIAVMGTAGMTAFQALLADGLVALRRHASRILSLVKITAHASPFPCFQGDVLTMCRRLKERLCADAVDDDWVRQHALALIARSAGSVRTKLYDQFQFRSNGYLV